MSHLMFEPAVTKSAGTTDLDQTRCHNAVNEIAGNGGDSITTSTGTNWADASYDATGNTILMPNSKQLGNGASPKYDAWNQMVYIQYAYELMYCEYDGLGQRIRKQLPNDNHEWNYYYNDRWQLLTEVKDGSVEAIYHWHPFYIDALATRMRASDTHFFTHDANFNVTAAVDDSTDAVVERYNYTPYGTPTVLDANFADDADQTSDIGNQHLYTGRERDPETGLQLNRHRYYASHLGRWLSRDPIGYSSDNRSSGKNLYEYVLGQPTGLVDPLGLAEIPPIMLEPPGPTFGPPWYPGMDWPPPPASPCPCKSEPFEGSQVQCTVREIRACRMVQRVPVPWPPSFRIRPWTPHPAMKPVLVCDIPIAPGNGLFSGQRCSCSWEETQLCVKKDCKEAGEVSIHDGGSCGVTYGGVTWGELGMGCSCQAPEPKSKSLCGN